MPWPASVVLDWNFLHPERRKTWRRLIEDAGFAVHLHFIDVPLETAIARAARRAELGDQTSYVLSAAEVRQHATIFVPPTPDEGIATTVIRGA